MNKQLSSIYPEVTVLPVRQGMSARWHSLWRKQFFGVLAQMQDGFIELRDPLGSTQFGAKDSNLHCQVTIADTATYQKIALAGSNGSAEAYIQGLWSCDRPADLMRILLRNRALLEQIESGLTHIAQSLLQAWHSRNHNSISGSRKNIAAHYDLGNDFFRLFLDQHMMYSSALYQAEDDNLDLASERKLHRICETLELCPNDRLLEIGSGWGGFACFAASRYGCHVTTITISQEQYDEALLCVTTAQLESQVQVKMLDYRHLEGVYDKLVSIEMIEAVGHHYLPQYFDVIRDSLKPGGKALLQAIVIDDSRYQRALREVDFIKRFIFPGSFIPCYSVIAQTAGERGLMLEGLFDMGLSYAQTLRDWRHRFYAAQEAVGRQGYDQKFQRMWEFYLCYCEAGFEERAISVGQILLRKQPV